MVGYLRVIHETASQRPFTGARRQVLAVWSLDGLDDARQRAGHILRQMPAIGSRIADEFVSLVERLRGIKSLLCAETEQAVGVPLELRQVVQRWRRHALRLSFDGLDRRLARARP